MKRIAPYLIGLKDKRMFFKPGADLTLNAFVDADFADLWGAEDLQDALCIKSRTGYIIQLGLCMIVWKLKLQTLIAVSTMEVEYVSLSMYMR